MNNYELITIIGPTASGKTAFAAALAARLDTEIISGDSRQVYRSMDIGTGKDLADYVVDGKQIPYHLWHRRIRLCRTRIRHGLHHFLRDGLFSGLSCSTYRNMDIVNKMLYEQNNSMNHSMTTRCSDPFLRLLCIIDTHR